MLVIKRTGYVLLRQKLQQSHITELMHATSPNTHTPSTMEATIITPRLKLTLLTAAEPGSQEFNWVHELRSNEQSSWWRYLLPLHTSSTITPNPHQSLRPLQNPRRYRESPSKHPTHRPERPGEGISHRLSRSRDRPTSLKHCHARRSTS